MQVVHAGDDGLDLMGAHVELADAAGLLAKNDLQIAVDGSLLYRTKTGVRVYTKTVRYAGESRIQADVLFVVGSEQPIRRDDRSALSEWAAPRLVSLRQTP